MEDALKQQLKNVANTIRGLSMDAIDQANSGHPGLPLGCAEIGAALYGCLMKHNPANPDWPGRDRFILSAGHGSMLLYSCLHLSGYDLPLEELKNFRQLGSKTPGHPEYMETPGVETTTGPLGQGFANACGVALGNKIVAAQLGIEKEGLLDGQVIALAGDGCMMEGITNEAASLAGHLKLDNLTVIYDSNDICLDGVTEDCFTEDTEGRFKALKWNVISIDGHDLDQIEKALKEAREHTGQPTLIVAKTVIGKGSPNKQGTSGAHGAPLGLEESKAAKEGLGLPADLFYISEEVKAFMEAHKKELAAEEKAWNERLENWKKAHPDKAKLWDCFVNQELPADLDQQLWDMEIKPGQAGRKGSNAVLQKLHELVPYFVGGSADLSCSDNTAMKASGFVAPDDYAHRNIRYGVREFAMSAMTNGLALQGMLRPFCGTFLTFSDYMRNAIRLASLMKLKVTYQFTHDSIFVGEDGPTHQPVEHVASLRTIPNLTVFRPADSNEIRAAWSWTLRAADGPVLFSLTRQGLKDLEGTKKPTAEGVARGAYSVFDAEGDTIDFVLLASGSEVGLAVEVAEGLKEKGKTVKVVSMPSWELFDAQDQGYRDATLALDKQVGRYVSIEAGVEQGWHKYIGRDGLAISMRSFGASAPGKDCGEHFGFSKEKVLSAILG